MFISYSHDPDHRHLESFGVMGDSATAMRDPIFYVNKTLVCKGYVCENVFMNFYAFLQFSQIIATFEFSRIVAIFTSRDNRENVVKICENVLHKCWLC